MSLNSHDFNFLQEALPFWDQLSDSQQKLVERTVKAQTYSAGSTLHDGSNDCSGLYIIKSGQVRTYILSDTGKEITLFRLFERDVCIFSASCMLKNIRFDVYIQAVEDSATLLIPTAIYQELNQHSIAVSDYTGQILATRFSDVMWLMEQIVFMSFDKRLAIYLLEQSAISESDSFSITHEKIANDMGTAREVVTRMLRYFQSEGTVALSRGCVTLTNRKKLNDWTK